MSRAKQLIEQYLNEDRNKLIAGGELVWDKDLDREVILHKDGSKVDPNNYNSLDKWMPSERLVSKVTGLKCSYVSGHPDYWVADLPKRASLIWSSEGTRGYLEYKQRGYTNRSSSVQMNNLRDLESAFKSVETHPGPY